MKALAHDAVDAAVRDVRAAADAWAQRNPAELAALLRLVRERVARVAAVWVDAACRIKGIDPRGPLAGEEWLSGPYAVAAACGAYADSLDALARGTLPFDEHDVRRGPEGRVVVTAFPRSFADRALFGFMSVEVWMRAGVGIDAVRAGVRAAGAARQRGAVAAVLGAGNITSIAPLDVLDQLVRHRRVVVLKPHPVLAPLDGVMADLLEPLVVAGAVRIVGGGVDAGVALTRHDDVDAVHLTGGERTYDAVVFGTGDDGARRKRDDDPLVRATVSAELGNVSPTIVVPGRWSASDLRYRATLVATQKAHNAGANCIAAQVLVTQRGWPQAVAFLDAVRAALSRHMQRAIWYPNVAGRFPEIAGGAQVRTVDAHGGDPLLCGEAFAPILAHVELDATDVPAFLKAATGYVSTVLPGSLGANLIVDARTVRAQRGAVERAILALRHGCVAVNAWTGVGFLMPTATWGAFPGNPRNAAGSGIGIVHDALLFPGELVERSVVRAPARIRPAPPWFLGHRNGTTVGPQLAAYAVSPTTANLVRVLAAAVRP